MLLAELQATFPLSPALLGGALTAGLHAALVIMPPSGRAANRWGAGLRLALVTAVLAGLGITLLSGLVRGRAGRRTRSRCGKPGERGRGLRAAT